EPDPPQQLVLAALVDLARGDTRDVPLWIADLALEHAPRRATRRAHRNGTFHVDHAPSSRKVGHWSGGGVHTAAVQRCSPYAGDGAGGCPDAGSRSSAMSISGAQSEPGN